MLELSWNGQKQVPVGNKTRTFIEDHDTIIMKGYCQRDGIRIGFGECLCPVLPSIRQ